MNNNELGNIRTSDVMALRSHVNADQKAWKFIRDVNSACLSDLNKTAIEDGRRKYTYGQMFREWERYASVFSALGMTGERHCRTGILGSTCAEAIIAVYGLNMVGAEVSIVPSYSALIPRKVFETIRSEKLTDFIVTDDFAQVNLLNELFAQRKELGLKNIIILHVPLAGVTVNRALTAAQDTKYSYLKMYCGPICMDELLKAYGDYPVQYDDGTVCDTAFILHTSGTTSGTGKPVALSDRAFNAAAATFYRMDDLHLPWDNLVTAVIVDLSNAYSMVDQVHLAFAVGAALVTVPGGILNPMFYKAIAKHRITFLFTVSAMFERWMKKTEKLKLDFSSLRFAVLGGAAVSAADKRRYYNFMKTYGAEDVTVLNGYGITELGGACCLSSADLDDEAIGYPLPDVSVRLYDEEHDRFLTENDKPCEGILYLNSPSVATPMLDGKATFEVRELEGKPYICTNDLVRLGEDGKLTFLGRARRYFINDEGRKYEAGRVETEVARQAGIETCCIVPVYIKTTHDNIPMLCVKTVEGEEAEAAVIRALCNIFVSGRTLSPDNIPVRVMIADEMPRNGNGKIDLFKITRGEVEGRVYTVEPVTVMDQITDFRLVQYTEKSADMIKEVFDGISAELKNSLPANTKQKETEEEKQMKNAKKLFDSFNSMNRMGMQMMKNMMGRMGQTDEPQSFDENSFANMPDMQKMMEGMKQLNMKANAGMKYMNRKAQESLPEMQEAVQRTAQTMVPVMRQQMNQMIDCMQQMNAAALKMMQTSFEQNCKVMNQIMDGVEKMAAAPAAKEAEAPAEAPAEEAPEETKPAKTAGRKKAAKTAE